MKLQKFAVATFLFASALLESCKKRVFNEELKTKSSANTGLVTSTPDTWSGVYVFKVESSEYTGEVKAVLFKNTGAKNYSGLIGELHLNYPPKFEDLKVPLYASAKECGPFSEGSICAISTEVEIANKFGTKKPSRFILAMSRRTEDYFLSVLKLRHEKGSLGLASEVAGGEKVKANDDNPQSSTLLSASDQFVIHVSHLQNESLLGKTLKAVPVEFRQEAQQPDTNVETQGDLLVFKTVAAPKFQGIGLNGRFESSVTVKIIENNGGTPKLTINRGVIFRMFDANGSYGPGGRLLVGNIASEEEDVEVKAITCGNKTCFEVKSSQKNSPKSTGLRGGPLKLTLKALPKGMWSVENVSLDGVPSSSYRVFSN